MARPQRGHELVEVALDDPIELGEREPDAVIGHAVLREVVGADLLRCARRSTPCCGASAASCASCFSRSMSRSRLLRTFSAFALFLSCERSSWHLTMMPARLVEDLHGAVGRVDALPAGAAARGDADLEVLLVDVHVDVVGLGEHGDRRGRRVDAPLRLGGRHALHAVHAALEAQLRVDVLAGDERDALLDAARRALAQREDLDLPALASRRSARTCGRGPPRRAPPLRRPRRCGSRGWCSSCRSGSGGSRRSWIDALEPLALAVRAPAARPAASSRSSGSASASSSSRISSLDVAVARERVDERLEVAALLVELRRARCGRTSTSGRQSSSSSSP